MSEPRYRGQPHWLARALAAPAAVYGAAVRARLWLYHRGWLACRRLPGRVISVGNLTVGGTGKTPLVIWIVGRLLAAGVRVAVLSRGYRRHGAARHVLVSDGQRLLAGPEEAGDEPYLVARRCPGAIVAVGANRYELGRWVLDRQAVNCFVLDDGFQHLGLYRDVNLLLVDVSDPTSLEALLPAGRLREPLRAIRRASAVVLTRADSSEESDWLWDVLHPYLDTGSSRSSQTLSPAPVSGAMSQPVSPIRVAFRAEQFIAMPGGSMKAPLDMVGRTAVIFSGIGNTGSFRELLERQGLKIVKEFVFRDHHRYSAADVEEITAAARRHAADVIVTTEKDAVKVESLLQAHAHLWALRLSCEILEGEERLRRLLLDEGRSLSCTESP